jgi:hypothetical protein
VGVGRGRVRRARVTTLRRLGSVRFAGGYTSVGSGIGIGIGIGIGFGFGCVDHREPYVFRLLGLGLARVWCVR